MTRTNAWTLASVITCIVVVAVGVPFITPDMPWWAGLATIVGGLAALGAEVVIKDLRR